MLGYSWDEVHDEEEKLEHVISEQFEDKIAELLNHPTVDPHGDPIPTKDGKMPKIKSRKLSSLEPGVECVVRRVKNQDSDILRKLERKGILPGVALEVVSNDTDQEKLTLKVEGKKVALSRTLASQIRVFQRSLLLSPAARDLSALRRHKNAFTENRGIYESQ